jgi:hypothetical protein
MDGDVVSALVIVRPAAGGTLQDEAITATNVEALQPHEEELSRARAFFENAGFSVTAAVGPSFAITASADLFEQVFGARPDPELDLNRLPEQIRGVVDAVTLSRPPDFGPTNP